MELRRVEALNGRWYQAEGDQPVPSVTNILNVWPKGEAFARWLGNASSYEDAIAYRDEAGEMGTRVHAAVESLLRGETVTANQVDDPRFYKLVRGFMNWYTEWEPEILQAEVRLYNPDEGYAGTCDIICEARGECWLIDVKTSKAAYDSYHLQTAAYTFASSEPVTKRGILLLKDNTKKGWQMCESVRTLDDDFEAFMAAKHIWHYINGWEPVLAEPVEPEEVQFHLGEE